MLSQKLSISWSHLALHKVSDTETTYSHIARGQWSWLYNSCRFISYLDTMNSILHRIILLFRLATAYSMVDIINLIKE